MNIIYRQQFILILWLVLPFILWYILYRLYLLLPWHKQSSTFILLSLPICTFGLLITVGCAVYFTDTFGHSFIVPNINAPYGKLEKVEFDKTIKDTYPLKDTLPNALAAFRNAGTKITDANAYGGIQVHDAYTTKDAKFVPTSIEVKRPSPTIYFVGYDEETGEPIDTVLEVVDDTTWKLYQGTVEVLLPNLSTLNIERDGEESHYIYLSSKTTVRGEYLQTVTITFKQLCDEYHSLLLQPTIYDNDFFRKFL